MTIDDILIKIKKDFEKAIITKTFGGKKYPDGQKAKEALIRSQILINYLHNFVKEELIKNNINPNKIFPRLGASKPEIKVEGFLKKKDQDICIVPDVNLINDKNETSDDKILSINVRSQLSSLAKNIDTLYERTFAEALNIHLKNPKQCLGEVYLIPTNEYDDKAMKDNQIKFKRCSNIEHYIKIFQAINNRSDVDEDEYKYERACLLIVDFNRSVPKLYSNIKELIKDGLVPNGSTETMDNLNIEKFAEDIIKKYANRFNVKKLY